MQEVEVLNRVLNLVMQASSALQLHRHPPTHQLGSTPWAKMSSVIDPGTIHEVHALCSGVMASLILNLPAGASV